MWMTLRCASPVNGSIEVFADDEEHAPAERRMGILGTVLNPPVLFSVLATGFACVWMFGRDAISIVGLAGAIICAVAAVAHFESRGRAWSDWYERLLLNAAPFSILTFIAVAVGGLIQIIPTVVIQKAANIEDRLQVKYTPLELAGRDIYVREGCYTCHSQMIRTLVPDVLRYGAYSRLGESIYDHPYQWGSKRNGPDLARVGGKYPNVWHLRHMEDPRALSQGSNMPSYAAMLQRDLDVSVLPTKISVQRTLGVPYPAWTADEIKRNVAEQSAQIAADLKAAGAIVAPEKEIIAMIAYLQVLGKSEPVTIPGVPAQ
jgi:cytochrome c oxidase cbb3-type subunit I/II